MLRSPRTIIRDNAFRIVKWEAMPPEAPSISYHVIHRTNHTLRGVFNTHQAAVEFCDQVSSLPFDKEQS